MVLMAQQKMQRQHGARRGAPAKSKICCKRDTTPPGNETSETAAAACYLARMATVRLGQHYWEGGPGVSAQQTLATSTGPLIVKPPRGSWLWFQKWHDLCFAHWQVPRDVLRHHLPPGLEVDTWNGTAWVSVVAFRLHIRRRWLPPLGFCGSFLELNLRTYVRNRDEPGIYFLSIHASKRLEVALANWLTLLPYAFAPIHYQRQAAVWHFNCRHAGAAEPALFDAQFTSTGVCTQPVGNSLDSWLLDRYRAFAADRRGRLYRMVVQHAPWPMQHAEAKMTSNQLGKAWGLELDRLPDEMHFSLGVPAWVWPIERIDKV
jgi:uncharacterized protein YqjF (DUF2071 family)